MCAPFYLSKTYICRTHQVKHQSQDCLTVIADSGSVTVSKCKVILFKTCEMGGSMFVILHITEK